MQMTPVGMVADANIAHWTFEIVILFHRNAQHLNAICHGDVATVAVRLLDVVVVTFQITNVVTIEFLVPLHGTKVGGRKKNAIHDAFLDAANASI